MKVKFANAQGIHPREIHGVQTLKAQLPPEWYSFANLEIITPANGGRQVDIAIILDDRILLVDIKDWHGKIKSEGGYWYKDDRRVDASPVKKIADNVRIAASLLRRHIQNNQKYSRLSLRTPLIDSCVVLTGRCNVDGIEEFERSRVFKVDEFIKVITDQKKRRRFFQEPNWIDRTNPLVERDSIWRDVLSTFFIGRNSNFRAQEMTYAGHRVISDAVYSHPDEMYDEYDCVEVNTDRSGGLLRVWDFGKAPVKFASEEYRIDITGRERKVLAYLADRHPESDRISLRPKTADPDNGMRYWEIFEKRKQLRRLRDFVRSDLTEYRGSERIEILRILLSHAAALHRMGAAHLDIGDHSVWVEMPATVKLSHFLAAHYSENRSLAEDRYAFLGNRTVLPEQIIGGIQDYFRKDVFLLGRVGHLVLFGEVPRSTEGNPPEWNPSIDRESEFLELHSWFDQALNVDSMRRFPNAPEMLESFNRSLGVRRNPTVLIERLQRYRKWKSLLDVLRAFPIQGDAIKDDDRVLVYRYEKEGKRGIVKLWKSSNWIDEKTDAARLIDFCERAELLSLQVDPHIAKVVDVGYLGDHLAVVLDDAGDTDLAALVSGPNIAAPEALAFFSALIDAVDAIHALGFAHGDLNPANIVIGRESGNKIRPVLIDILEFGEKRHNPAYSPAVHCGTFERDRFAVLKMAEEILLPALVEEPVSLRIREAIEICKTNHPGLSTLQPLKDVITDVLCPKSDQQVLPKTTIHIVGLDSAKVMHADEGQYYIRISGPVEDTRISIIGADSELLVFLNKDGNVQGAHVRRIDQSRVAIASRKALCTVVAQIELRPSRQWEFSDFAPFLDHPEVQAALGYGNDETPAADDEIEQELVPQPEGFVEEDLGTEVRPLEESSAERSIAELWTSLLDAEAESSTEAVAEEDSRCSDDIGRHFVSYTRTRGTFDFDRNDIVEVKIAHPRRDAWITLGKLDLDRTTGGVLSITAASSYDKRRGPLCRSGAVLRIESFFELDSRNRRIKASKQILSRKAVLPNLIDYFEANTDPETKAYEQSPKRDQLVQLYGLNPSQADSFLELWATGPLGLLQGPPGTGKTKFIAAFVHYALTSGRMKNVLLASQSHEAVNNAAEEILELFKRNGGLPSLVRVGQEGVISDRLMPFHSAQVEQLYRERFRARLNSTYLIAGKRLGLPEDFINTFFEAAVQLRPILRRIDELKTEHSARRLDADEYERRGSALRSAAMRIVGELGISDSSLAMADLTEELFQDMVRRIADNHNVKSKESVRRLLRILSISDDWLGQVGTRRRNFEEFLVNTKQIVAGTCVGLGRAALGLADAVFDLVIIDEAARCTASELAVPMQSGKRILLVGDHMQLEPFHNRTVLYAAAEKLSAPMDFIRQSDFKRAFDAKYGRENGQTLRIQYRMLEPIGRLISEVFYEPQVRLQHGRSAPKIPEEVELGSLTKAVTWLDTSPLGVKAFQRETGKRSKSLQNQAEADAIIRLLSQLDGDEPFCEWLQKHFSAGEQPIGIICGYKGQKQLLGMRINASGISNALLERIKIDTVDSYQGKQNLIVIVSLVRNNSDGPQRTILQGFMRQPNRINVALSRAMDRLVIVGSINGWPLGGPMAAVASKMRELELDGQGQIISIDPGEGKRNEERAAGRTKRQRR